MRRAFARGILFLGAVAMAGAAAWADVKTEERSSAKLGGAMGRVMGFLGGRAAKEGVTSTVAVKGDRKMTANEYTGEIIDLGEQKVYLLDMKKKNYEVVTFEEMRRRMKEAQEKAAEAAKEQPRPQEPEGGKQMEIDFSAKESGQTRTINGYDCREVVVTVTAREKGKTLEQGGGMVMTAHEWLGPKIAAMKEIAEFDMRYYKALGEPFADGQSVEAMAVAMAMYPAMKEMMGKVQAEHVNMEGTPILTETTMEAVTSPEQASQESRKEQESQPGASIGRIGGLLGRKIMKKKEEPAAQASNRANIMTMTRELVKVSTDVATSDVTVPAGFKKK